MQPFGEARFQHGTFDGCRHADARLSPRDFKVSHSQQWRLGQRINAGNARPLAGSQTKGAIHGPAFCRDAIRKTRREQGAGIAFGGHAIANAKSAPM